MISMSVPKRVQATSYSSSSGNLFAWSLPLLLATTLQIFVRSAVKCECLVEKHRSVRINPASSKELYPPLVLLGGIAQTKSSWDHHLLSLARNRKVLVYECLGQGDHAIPNDSDVDASLPGQAQLLLDTLEETLVNDKGDGEPVLVDIVGFSFGGRVAMAATCLQTDCGDHDKGGVRIRRLHLTGIGCDRSDSGHLAMQSFPDVIRSDRSLRCFAWSILLATYSSGYLKSLPEKTLQRFLDHVASSNKPEGLIAIIEQAEVSDKGNPWHVVNMARRLAERRNETPVIPCQLCVGEFDKMAPVEEVQRLSQNSNWISSKVDVLSDCGHAVVLEKPREWRESVLSFLDVCESNNEEEEDGTTAATKHH